MNWAGKRVLVTGAGGFIGSHLAEALVKLGAQVRAFVHYNALGSRGWLDHSSLSDEMEILAGDICDSDSVDRAIENSDYVFHLAALIAIPYSYLAPESYIRTNVGGTLNVLRAVQSRGVERLIHTSTSEVYGTALSVPISEDHPLQAQSPYSASKIAADKLVESFTLSYDLPAVTVRPFNAFGPRQSARAVIPTIITQCLTGNVVQLGNLHPTRDLNYVANIVDGFILAAIAPAAEGTCLNIGSGTEISIGDLAYLIADKIDAAIEIRGETSRERPDKSEVDRLVADSSEANRIMGWNSQIDLETGLVFTINWYRDHIDRYRPDVYSI